MVCQTHCCYQCLAKTGARFAAEHLVFQTNVQLLICKTRTCRTVVVCSYEETVPLEHRIGGYHFSPPLTSSKVGQNISPKIGQTFKCTTSSTDYKKHTYTGLSYQKSTNFEPNPKSKIHESTKFQKFQIQNPKSKILNPKSQIQNPNAQNSNSQIQNPKKNKIQRCS